VRELAPCGPPQRVNINGVSHLRTLQPTIRATVIPIAPNLGIKQATLCSRLSEHIQFMNA
jgi:hypothetical protein